MRLLHTSDWHLGRSLITEPLVEAQRAFLAWLADLARDREVDAILVCGDVYDRAIPSVDAVRLLESALVDLSQVCPVVLVSGNHDSATRLGFGGPLFERSGVHLRSSVADIARPVDLLGRDGTVVLAYGIPYLEPELVRGELGSDKSHEAVLTSAMDRVRADLAERRTASAGGPVPRAVVLAHAFIHGGTISDSERDVSVGGIADAPASVFAGVDYVALGHLHRPQPIATDAGPAVRYSGTPMAYSFSEEAHDKSVSIVDIDADGAVSVEQVPTPVPRRLRTIAGPLDDLLADPALAAFEDCWVRAELHDGRRPENAMDRLRTRFPGTLELAWVPHVDGRPVTTVDHRIDPATSDPVAVVLAFIEHVTSTPATDEEAALVRESIERIRVAEAAR